MRQAKISYYQIFASIFLISSFLLGTDSVNAATKPVAKSSSVQTVSKKTPAVKPLVKKTPAKAVKMPVKSGNKTAPRPAAKTKGKQEAATLENVKVGKTWRGVVTGVENSETFYLKQRYTVKLGELTIKVTPDTKYIAGGSPTDMSGLKGGDYVEVVGVKSGKVVKANTVTYINEEFLHR